MKLVIDERAKHRIVGIAVLLSIVVVFAPAILKKSQQRFEESVSISVKLPPKPKLPDVAVREPKALFQAVKVARVDIPKDRQIPQPQTIIAKAQPLSALPATIASDISTKKAEVLSLNTEPSELVQAINSNLTTHITAAVKPNVVVAQQAASKPKVVSPSAVKSSPGVVHVPAKIVSQQQPIAHPNNQAYRIQLGSFAQKNNAIALVNKLKAKGYSANYYPVTVKGLVYYKVIAGNAVARDKAQQLQRQLAQAVQLNGFIVPRGVG